MASIVLRRGTTEEWAEINPVLFEGELGLDLTYSALKVGNGVDPWLELPYLVGGEETPVVTSPVDSVNGQVGDITITLADLGGAPIGHSHTPGSIGAAALGHTHTASEVGAASVAHTHTAAEVGAIPTGDVSAIDVCTQAEYDALVTKSPSTLYVIKE